MSFSRHMSPLWGVLDSDIGQIWPQHEKFFWISIKQTIWNKWTWLKIFKDELETQGKINARRIYDMTHLKLLSALLNLNSNFGFEFEFKLGCPLCRTLTVWNKLLVHQVLILQLWALWWHQWVLHSIFWATRVHGWVL